MLLRKIQKVILDSNTLEQLKGSKVYLNLAFAAGLVSFKIYNLLFKIIIKKEEILKTKKTWLSTDREKTQKRNKKKG